MSFKFISGSRALDFAETLRQRHTDPVEQLASPSDLALWISASGIVSNQVDIDNNGLAKALQLREAIYRLAQAVMMDERLNSEDRIKLNTLAEHATISRHLPEAGMIEYRGDLDAILSYLAREAMTLTAIDPNRIRNCAHEQCSAIFIDRSRGNRRHWCDMTRCGNAINAQAYRRRSSSNTRRGE
jgi:predicted RNA-binding Zn ribbon-like protein